MSKTVDRAAKASRLGFITTTLHCARTRVCSYVKDNNPIYTDRDRPAAQRPRYGHRDIGIWSSWMERDLPSRHSPISGFIVAGAVCVR
jgi:hypothetical protein